MKRSEKFIVLFFIFFLMGVVGHFFSWPTDGFYFVACVTFIVAEIIAAIEESKND